MVKIGIDASGGDNGEKVVIEAVINSIKKNDDISISIFGDEEKIISAINDLGFDYTSSKISIVDAKEKIDMNDHPVIAIRTKSNSSIVKAGTALINGDIDVFVSAGNTGALVALAQFYLKPIEGVDRPVLGAIVPTNKSPMLLIDSGCNVDSKPEWLYQYAILASVYYKMMFDVESPSIGLLSVGTEENKGNNLTLSAYKLIKENKDLNFIGNVEARDLTYGVCDIVVTDGFAGNVFIKTYEGTAKLLLDLIKKQIKSNPISMIGGALIKPALKKLLTKYDAKAYGGAPILGANKLIIKCHGNSETGEYMSTIKQAYELVNKKIVESMKEFFVR